MNINPQQLQAVKLLADLGPLLTILLIMRIVDQPATTAELSRLCRIHVHTAKRHLNQLADDFGYASADSSGYWMLTTGGRGLLDPLAGHYLAKSEQAFARISRESREIDSLPSSSAPQKFLLPFREEEEEEEENARNSRAPDPEILAALKAAGIGINRRTLALAANPWITPIYIAAHHRDLTERGKGKATGLLITILESAEPAPEPSGDHDYLSGKYSDLLQH